MNPPTVLKAKLYKLGNFFVGVPGFDRRDGAFTQVVGVSLRHSRLAPLVPVGILNPIRASLGIPPDSTFPENALGVAGGGPIT